MAENEEIDIIKELTLSQGDALLSPAVIDARKKVSKAKNSEAIMIQALAESVEQLKAQMTDKDFIIKVQEGRICRLEKQLEVLTQRVIDNEAHQMGKNLVISGIAENEDESTDDLVKDFFKGSLCIQEDISIESSHRQGTKSQTRKNPRIIIARLAKRSDVRLVLGKGPNLAGTKFKINSQVPPEVRTNNSLLLKKKKKLKETMPTGTTIHVVDEKLVVDKVVKIDMKRDRAKCVDKDTKTIETVKKLTTKIQTTGVIKVGTSYFKGHVVKVDDKSELKAALAAIYMDESVAKATHNSYALRLDAETELMHDDGEPGSAQKIIDVMHANEVTGAICVVSRWYFGHMGNARFDAIEQAANNALLMI